MDERAEIEQLKLEIKAELKKMNEQIIKLEKEVEKRAYKEEDNWAD
jgi:hypothetical protein